MGAFFNTRVKVQINTSLCLFILLLFGFRLDEASANIAFDCSRLAIETEVAWLPPQTTRQVTVEWLLSVSSQTQNLRPEEVEIEDGLPQEAVDELRSAVLNIRCNVKSSGGRHKRYSQGTYGLSATIDFLGKSLESLEEVNESSEEVNESSEEVNESSEGALKTLSRDRRSDIRAETNFHSDFNPIEQRIRLLVVINDVPLAGQPCRVNTSNEQFGFPLKINSGEVFVTPITLTSNLLMASCEVAPYMTVSQSITRDKMTGIFPSTLQIQLTEDEFQDLKKASESATMQLEQALAAELAEARRAAEQARIAAAAERERISQEEEQQAKVLAENEEKEKRASVINDALQLLESAKTPLLEFYQIYGMWPVALSGPYSLGAILEKTSSAYAFNIRLIQSSLTPFESAILSVTLYNSELEGDLSLAYDGRTAQWLCFSTDIELGTLPSHCGNERPNFPKPTSVFDF